MGGVAIHCGAINRYGYTLAPCPQVGVGKQGRVVAIGTWVKNKLRVYKVLSSFNQAKLRVFKFFLLSTNQYHGYVKFFLLSTNQNYGYLNSSFYQSKFYQYIVKLYCYLLIHLIYTIEYSYRINHL